MNRGQRRLSRLMKPLLLALLMCSLVSCATETDIWGAVNERNPRAVRHCLQHGASPNTHDETGWSVLHNACWLGSPKVVEILVAAGADVNATGNNIFTPRFEAMWRDIPEFKQKIWPATRRATPLHTAISGGGSDEGDESVCRQRIVRILLSHGANPNLETRDGMTAAALATKEQPDILPLLR